MKLKVDRNATVPVIALEGALTYPEGTADLRKSCHTLLDNGVKDLVIDLLDVPWLDSSGIGEVVACFKRAREKGGSVKLVLRARPHNSFTFCHLDRMFEMFDARGKAIDSFSPQTSA